MPHPLPHPVVDQLRFTRSEWEPYRPETAR